MEYIHLFISFTKKIGFHELQKAFFYMIYRYHLNNHLFELIMTQELCFTD